MIHNHNHRLVIEKLPSLTLMTVIVLMDVKFTESSFIQVGPYVSHGVLELSNNKKTEQINR